MKTGRGLNHPRGMPVRRWLPLNYRAIRAIHNPLTVIRVWLIRLDANQLSPIAIKRSTCQLQPTIQSLNPQYTERIIVLLEPFHYLFFLSHMTFFAMYQSLSSLYSGLIEPRKDPDHLASPHLLICATHKTLFSTPCASELSRPTTIKEDGEHFWR